MLLKGRIVISEIQKCFPPNILLVTAVQLFELVEINTSSSLDQVGSRRIRYDF